MGAAGQRLDAESAGTGADPAGRQAGCATLHNTGEPGAGRACARTVGSLNVAQKCILDPNSSVALTHQSTNIGMLASTSQPPRSSNHCGRARGCARVCRRARGPRGEMRPQGARRARQRRARLAAAPDASARALAARACGCVKWCRLALGSRPRRSIESSIAWYLLVEGGVGGLCVAEWVGRLAQGGWAGREGGQVWGVDACRYAGSPLARRTPPSQLYTLTARPRKAHP